MTDDLDIIILAAGMGTRMKSDTVKILHRAAGRPIIEYVLDTAAALSSYPPIMVVGHQREAVQQAVGERASYAVQEPQLGTGHAVMQALPHCTRRRVLILSGDVPLTRPETLTRLVDEHVRGNNALTVLTMRVPGENPYGRIMREADGSVARIVEVRDASDTEKQIEEVNAGIYVFDREHLSGNLQKLSTNNAQGEYYLTDLVGLLRAEGRRIGAVLAPHWMEAIGVNSRGELAMVETVIQQRVISRLMDEGVTFRNPNTAVIDSTVSVDRDTVIYPFVTLEGNTRIGRKCVVEPGVHLINVTVGENVHLKTGTVAEDAVIEDDANVGPYAHLRLGTKLGRNVKVGNFVETKKAIFGDGAKASHLSYIGDADVGANVNIGAGTITCNYDGVRKNKTIIEDGAFIGSDTQLVAPVRVGKGAYVGAGSTITKDVPPDALALSRTPQRIVEGWAKKKKS
jgi:bifunctional UDP-N-acetylglucosamine pyrophosphorylase/glucosamine-1-phosphate N-acetyltransferase